MYSLSKAITWNDVDDGAVIFGARHRRISSYRLSNMLCGTAVSEWFNTTSVD